MGDSLYNWSTILEMKKISTLLLFVTLLCSSINWAQRGVRIGYIDMDIILENVDEYKTANVLLNKRVEDWKKEIESLQKKLKTESGFVEKSLKKLKNPGFLNKAPEKVIVELREKVASTEKTLEALKLQIHELDKLVE